MSPPRHRGWDACDDSEAIPRRMARRGVQRGRTEAQGFALQLGPQPGGPCAVNSPSVSLFPSKPCNLLGFLAPIELKHPPRRWEKIVFVRILCFQLYRCK